MTLHDNFSVMTSKAGNFLTKSLMAAALLLMAALLPWPAQAGTAGKVYNLSLDVGTLDNHPLFSITSFPATFKVRAKVIDQLGAPITGLSATQLVVYGGNNATTGAAWAPGTTFTADTFTEIGGGLYDWTVTLYPGALGNNELGQFEVRVIGAPATDNQWLAATIFVKNGPVAADDIKYVEVQPGMNNDGYSSIGDYGVIINYHVDFPLNVHFFSPGGGGAYAGEVNNSTTPTGDLFLGVNNWTESTGGYPYGYAGFNVAGYHNYSGGVDYYLFINAGTPHYTIFSLGEGQRQYITLSIQKGNKKFLLPMGLTAVGDPGSHPYPLPVPTYSNPNLFPVTKIQNYRQGSPSVTSPPGAGPALANTLLIWTNSGTDAVNSVTLDLGAGGAAAVSRIDITDSAGTTVYGSVSNPASDLPVVTFSSALPITTGLSFYYVRVTPKTHADMPLPPGSSQLVPAGATTIGHTAGNAVEISDWGTPDLTIDNLSPANPAWASIVPGNGQVDLAWTNPGDADYSQAVILRSTATVADAPVEGASYTAGHTIGASTVACVVAKPGVNCTDTGLTNGTGYFYRIFAKDTNGNYSDNGNDSGPHVLGDQTTPGSCAAVSAGPTTIDVTMPYSNDANGNNGYTVDYRLSCIVPDDPFMIEPPTPCNTPWTNWVTAAPHAASPYRTTITGLAQGATYDVRCAFLDADAVQAPNPQEISGIIMFDNRTSAGIATAAPASATSIAVNMPYVDDYNADSTYTVDYQLAVDSGWTNWVTTAPHAASPVSLTITGLQQGSTYNVRLTYVDSDGVKGTNPQTIANITLPDNRTEAQWASAVAVNSATIQVTAPFAYDANGNGTIKVDYKLSYLSEWLAATGSASRSGSNFVMTIGGLTPSSGGSISNYDIRVTYVDPDGVIGTAEQFTYWIAMPSSKLIHNSLNANSKGYWGPAGWGIPGGQYGEFTCMTCHELRTKNAAGIKQFINLMPLPGSDNFGGPVRFDGPGGPGSPYSFGDDSAPKPDWQTGTYRICEVCHTQTYGMLGWQEDPPGSGIWVRIEGPTHRKAMSAPSNHAGSNGQDCTRCHPHDNGFGVKMGP